MQLRPIGEDRAGKPAYPAKSEHFCTSREFLRIAITLGLCACPAILPKAYANDKPKIGQTESQLIPKDKLKPTVNALAAKLSDPRFKIREGATLKLIQIGLGKHSAAKEKDEALKVLTELIARLKQAKDPEVAVRIRRIGNALSPKPKPPKVIPDIQHADGMVIEIE